MLDDIAAPRSRGALLVEVPAFGLALLIAELAFKLGSFTLELVAFLGMWFVLRTVAQQMTRLSSIRRRNPETRL